MRVAMVLVLCAALAHAAEAPRLVILRGTPGDGASSFTFLTDETGLERAQLAGVSGAELLALKGQRLLEQAELYREAQRAAGAKTPEPLYVILDPVGTWAYARPWGTFTYQREGRAVGPVTTPYLHLGEKMDHRGQAVEVGEGGAAANRAMVAKARQWFEAQMAAKGARRVPDFERDVLDGWQLRIGGGAPRGLSQVTADVTSDRFAQYLERAAASAAAANGIDLKTFDPYKREMAGLAEQGMRASLAQSVAETVAHELGHVIQFAALGLYQFRGSEPAIHMDGMSHTLRTLSTPEFALVEGWGEANSMVVVGLPRERARGEANRIDYQSTADYLVRATNDRAGRLVSARLHRDKLLAASEPLTTPALDGDPDRFLAELAKTARARGMNDEAWGQLAGEIAQDAERADLERARRYVASLQARRGQLRSRYDFLRSEYAVANVLARLREALGLAATREVCETLARHRPRDLASLIERYVHDHPQRKLETYRVIASATEGILITPAQVAAIEAGEKAGRPLEIDVDQDGQLPGASAAAAHPELFPRDMPAPGQEPLRAPQPRAATVAAAARPDAPADAIAAAPAAEELVLLAPGRRTAPPAEVPEMEGLERM